MPDESPSSAVVESDSATVASATAHTPSTTTESSAGQQQQQQQQQNGGGQNSFWSVCRTMLVRAVMIYCITSMFRRTPPATPPPADGQQGGSSAPDVGVPHLAANMFENGTVFDLYVYLGETGTLFHQQMNNNNSSHHELTTKQEQQQLHLVWHRAGLVYGDWVSGPAGDGLHHHRHQLVTTPHMRSNGSLYWHVFAVRAGQPFSASRPAPAEHVLHRSRRMTRFRRRQRRRTHNLLTGVSEHSSDSETTEQKSSAEEEEGAPAVELHWHPNITVSLVYDFTGWSARALVPPLDQYIEFSADGRRYKPIVFINDYWNLGRDYQPLNSSVPQLDLELTYQPIGLFKFQMYSSMALRNRWMSALTSVGSSEEDHQQQQQEQEDDEQDSLKEALLTTNVYLVVLTGVVSLLHSVFELLAFKNDVQFWNRRDSLEGLSVRSVMFGVFQALVVLLYVLDNETNTMIRVSCFIGLLIELWKVGRVTDVTVQWRAGLLPRVSVADKGSYVQSNTRVYDQMAFRYVSWLAFPLFAGYAVYSLLYTEHSGWYSFTLSLLYGFLLTFGFIMMTPQLFINYKLKSVAHLPWRMLTYKALNTFIDDIFAFVIRMPMMYRIGCLRDDVVFFVFLYQRYIYRVDPSRVNEFGFSQEMLQTGAGAGAVEQGEGGGAGAELGSSAGQSGSVSGERVPVKSSDDKKNE